MNVVLIKIIKKIYLFLQLCYNGVVMYRFFKGVMITMTDEVKTKFCKHCGEKIPEDAVICTKCGRQVEEIKSSKSENVIINNNVNDFYGNSRKQCDKWVSFLLCFFLGGLGAHKFYEGKVGLGVLYFLTAGLCGVGWFIDIISILFKPNPYYV